ncbi:MAG TPA: spermine synthase, partial [Opitutae bacterium]|nr:spermine synthase [Opitutae bacterium]
MKPRSKIAESFTPDELPMSLYEHD